MAQSGRKDKPSGTPNGEDRSTVKGTVKAGGKPPVKPMEETFFRIWLPTLIVALFIITFVVQPFDIPSASMEDTMLIGDHLFADRVRFAPPPPSSWSWILPYRLPRHEDTAVFLSLTDLNEHIVKRVIGIPGDHIRLVHSVVYRNGQALPEPYTKYIGVYDPARDDWPDGGSLMDETSSWMTELPGHVQNGEVVVPPGHYFMMGDNRDNSADSRYWGFVPEANLIGRPSIVYWSYRSTEADYESTGLLDRLGSLVSVIVHLPVRSRWSRTFHLVR